MCELVCLTWEKWLTIPIHILQHLLGQAMKSIIFTSDSWKNSSLLKVFFQIAVCVLWTFDSKILLTNLIFDTFFIPSPIVVWCLLYLHCKINWPISCFKLYYLPVLLHNWPKPIKSFPLKDLNFQHQDGLHFVQFSCMFEKRSKLCPFVETTYASVKVLNTNWHILV